MFLVSSRNIFWEEGTFASQQTGYVKPIMFYCPTSKHHWFTVLYLLDSHQLSRQIILKNNCQSHVWSDKKNTSALCDWRWAQGILHHAHLSTVFKWLDYWLMSTTGSWEVNCSLRKSTEMKTLIYNVLGLVLLAHRALSAPSEREYNYLTARLEPTSAGQSFETWGRGDTQPFQRGGGGVFRRFWRP